MSSTPALAGVRTALIGSVGLMAVVALVALPIGVGAAIYLEEYAHHGFINRLIETNVRNLAGVPSIIYGMLGLAIFVRALAPFSSGLIFGITTLTRRLWQASSSASRPGFRWRDRLRERREHQQR